MYVLNIDLSKRMCMFIPDLTVGSAHVSLLPIVCGVKVCQRSMTRPQACQTGDFSHQWVLFYLFIFFTVQIC